MNKCKIIIIISAFIIYYINKLIIHFLIKNKLKINSEQNMINLIINRTIFNNNNKKRNKNLVYSALLGNYDKIKPFNKQNGFDYFLFTDIKINIKTNWTILDIPNQVKGLNLNVKKKQRFIKLHPHLFFKNYDLSIYIDTNIIIFGKLSEFLERFLTPKISIYVLEHPRRNCIYLEILKVMLLHKDKKKTCLKVRNKYLKTKFPKKIGLSENCILIRRHNNINSIHLMKKWWNEIKQFSHRDQLSFNYILWKTGIKIKYISKAFMLHYFKFTKHFKKKLIKK